MTVAIIEHSFYGNWFARFRQTRSYDNTCFLTHMHTQTEGERAGEREMQRAMVIEIGGERQRERREIESERKREM